MIEPTAKRMAEHFHSFSPGWWVSLHGYAITWRRQFPLFWKWSKHTASKRTELTDRKWVTTELDGTYIYANGRESLTFEDLSPGKYTHVAIYDSAGKMLDMGVIKTAVLNGKPKSDKAGDVILTNLNMRMT